MDNVRIRVGNRRRKVLGEEKRRDLFASLMKSGEGLRIHTGVL